MAKPRVLLVVASLAAPAAIHAQLAPIAPGSRVRGDARPAGVRRFDATLISQTDDTLVLARDGRTMRIPVQGVRRLELFRGHDRRAGARRGAIGGAVGGAFFGAMIAGIASGHSKTCAPPDYLTCESTPFSRGEILRWTAVGGGGGLLYGAGIGWLIGRQRWERLTPARASLAPVPGGVGVRVAIGR